MNRNQDWNTAINRLRAQGSLRIVQFELRDAVTQDDLAVMRLMEMITPPPAIMQFFKSTDGVKLLWNGTLAGELVQGTINILTLLQSAGRAPAQVEGEPLEDVLWNDEFPSQILSDLKRMAIFEAIAGRSAYLTYFIDQPDARLFLVEDDDIRPIIPDFDTTIELLKTYAGADNLREYLTHPDWQARIRADAVLQRIAAL
jgi:hypothetical protein